MGHRTIGGGRVMQVTFKTTGFKELSEAFRIMPPEVANRVLASAVLAGAKVIEGAAKAAAPRGGDGVERSNNSYIYGRLRYNLKARSLRKRRETSRAAIVTPGRAFWGDLLNRGTRYIPASNWYENALRRSEDIALKTVQDRMVTRIQAIANKVLRQTGAAK